MFVLVVFLFYSKVIEISFDDFKNVGISNYISLICAFVLVFVNWGLELWKWKFSISVVHRKVNSRILLESLFSGITTGIVTPNRIGNFLGRMIYFPKKSRSNLIFATLYGNLAQFNATVLLGGIGFLFYVRSTGISIYSSYVNFFLFLLITLALLTYFVFPFISFFQKKLFYKYQNSLGVFMAFVPVLMKPLFVLSLLRFTIFVLQFVLVFHAFGVSFSSLLMIGVLTTYFISTLIPTLFLGKLLVRETIALYILSAWVNEAQIITSSMTLWLINLGVPALVGLFILLRLKSVKL